MGVDLESDLAENHGLQKKLRSSKKLQDLSVQSGNKLLLESLVDEHEGIPPGTSTGSC